MDIKQIQNTILPGNVKLREFQEKLLEIFLYFKKICEENGLTYWCGGGTMLGAVRHGGFIPWDDDLDVFMPRKDYERLYDIWDDVADTSHYILARTDRHKNYHHTAMNLVDITTTYVNKHSENEDIFHGCYIDVIPFEGCPNSKLGRAMQIYHSIMYGVFNVQRLPDNQSKIFRIPTKWALNLIKNPENRFKIWTKHQSKMIQHDFFTSEYVKETVTSFRALFYRYRRHVFDLIQVPFEEIMVNIPAGYDEYMKRIYGDYMSIPKKLDMSSRYDVIKYINLKEPFTKFKGIYYLTDK